MRTFTYNGWFKDTIQTLIKDQDTITDILNLGSGSRPMIEIIKTEDDKTVSHIFNADWVNFKQHPDGYENSLQIKNCVDILDLLEKAQDESFDHIIGCRYFEHIPWNQLGYYLYQMYRCLEVDGLLKFVVPDFTRISKALSELNEEFEYQKWVTLNSEYFNEKSDPHSCLWTEEIAKPLLEGEGYFKDTTVENITIDGRHWYIEITAKKSPKCLFKK
jgi:hypothetical protein